MAENKSWSNWWWRFLGLAPDGIGQALEVLSRRYIEEKQHSARFTVHAKRMRYPQFRDKLLAIAAAESKHADWLAEKINSLGGRLPDVPATTVAEKSSWQCLLDDLTEEGRCADELFEEARELRDDLPSIAELLERIYQEEIAYRGELRKMLMRSDPQAH